MRVFLAILLVLSFKPLFAQDSFEPLAYEANVLVSHKEGVSFEACETAKETVSQYFDMVTTYNKEFVGYMAEADKLINIWFNKINKNADSEIFYKEDSFRAIINLSEDINKSINIFLDNSYLLEEDGYFILDDIVPDCFEESADEISESFESLIADSRNVESVYSNAVAQINESIIKLYQQVSVYETTKTKFSAENLELMQSIISKDTDSNSISAVNFMYNDISEFYIKKQNGILEKL